MVNYCSWAIGLYNLFWYLLYKKTIIQSYRNLSWNLTTNIKVDIHEWVLLLPVLNATMLIYADSTFEVCFAGFIDQSFQIVEN